jgi:hypothetical protein
VSVRIRLRILMSDVLVALARAVRPDEPASRVVDREPRHQDERAEASRDAGPSAQPAVPGPVVDGGPPAHWVELVRARAPDLLRPSAAGREHAIRTSAPAPPGAGSTRRAPNAAAATTSAPVARPAAVAAVAPPSRAAPRRAAAATSPVRASSAERAATRAMPGQNAELPPEPAPSAERPPANPPDAERRPRAALVDAPNEPQWRATVPSLEAPAADREGMPKAAESGPPTPEPMRAPGAPPAIELPWTSMASDEGTSPVVARLPRGAARSAIAPAPRGGSVDDAMALPEAAPRRASTPVWPSLPPPRAARDPGLVTSAVFGLGEAARPAAAAPPALSPHPWPELPPSPAIDAPPPDEVLRAWVRDEKLRREQGGG